MSIIGLRRRPYAYDCVINGTGVMLGKTPGQPQFISTKAVDYGQASPTSFEYGALSPLRERVQPYESLVLGLGLGTQQRFSDGRYASAVGVDLSVWPWCKGPEMALLTPGTVDATAGVRTFFELGGTLYVAEGRYILRRANDTTWTVAKDFGPTISVLNATVFTSNFDGVQRVFAALSTGVAQYSSDGTTWTPMATFTALAFAAIGREFWWAQNTNLLRKCDTNANPTVEANYTALQFRVGDQSSPISSLAVTAAGTLLILKTDGVYTLDGAGDDHNLYPFLKFAADTENGKHWGQFENDVYMAYGHDFFRLRPDLSLEPIGPDRQTSGQAAAVGGRVTAFCGVGTLFGYAGWFDPDGLMGSLLKFGAYAGTPGGLPIGGAASTSQGGIGELKRIDAWHGSISQLFASRAIQALFVSTIGAPTNHTRTYIGFSDGSLGWLINPCVVNPAACPAYRFSTLDGYVDLALWHGTFQADPKGLRALSVVGPKLNGSNYVRVEYKTDPSLPTWTDFGTLFDTTVREKAGFQQNTSAVLMAFRVHLLNATNLESPLVSAFAIHHAVRPERVMQFEADTLCADGLVKRDGTPLRIGRKGIREAMQIAVDSINPVRVILPDETDLMLSFVDYSEAQAFDEVGRQWRGALHWKAVQFQAVVIYGTYGRMEAYRYVDLEQLSYQQIEGL
jgi:hypothetical protein